MNEFKYRRKWGPDPKYPCVQNYIHPHDNFTLIAGPCSVETEMQIHDIAVQVAVLDATHLRGGIFRAGTYPPDKFGWVDERLMSAFWFAAQNNSMQNIVEVLDYRDLDKIDQYASCYQIGARQMQNYTLLKEVGGAGKPVFLKRNPGAKLDEWLGSAEYLLQYGCKELYLIERGSSTHVDHVRWDLSISMIPAVQAITNIPILVDGSHGTGRRDLVAPMTLAGVAAGANGCLIETHSDPRNSLSDADQALSIKEFAYLTQKIINVRGAIK